jgi:hypothetical protein
VAAISLMAILKVTISLIVILQATILNMAK